MVKTIITPESYSLTKYLKELVRYKDLFITLAYRDFKVKYAQTFLGFFWAVIQQIVAIAVFALIRLVAFGNGSSEIPVLLFVSTGIFCWTYFDYVLTQSGSSIIQSANMIKKIYFPRLILPYSKSLVGFIDFFIGLLILTGFFIYYKTLPAQNVLFFPLYIISIICASLGLGTWVSAITIRYRDFQHIVPFFLRIGMFLTPIFFSSKELLSRVPASYYTITEIVFYLNPMAGNIEGIKWCLFNDQPLMPMSFLSVIVSIGLFISSLFYFKEAEKRMADLL